MNFGGANPVFAKELELPEGVRPRPKPYWKGSSCATKLALWKRRWGTKVK